MPDEALQAAFEIKAACDDISRKLLRWHWEEKPGAHSVDALMKHLAQRQKESPDYYERLPELNGRTGWQQLAARRLTEEAPMLYSLQSGYFFPAQQLAKANGEAESENHVTIQVLGACRSVAYTPYGGGDGLESALDARDLTGEGMTDPTQRSYEAALYPVEESYLLQQQLAQAETDSDYRTGESVYRQWAYDHYLTVPQDTYDALTAQFTPGQGWNTTQAKTEISRFLAANLTLREGTVTPATGDVAAWLLTGARQGYSVHYATLTTLLLRCCGIPARYVEGYVVTRQQAEALSDGAQLTLTQRAAHAWACLLYTSPSPRDRG